jgi:hypothetical protein
MIKIRVKDGDTVLVLYFVFDLIEKVWLPLHWKISK